MTNDIHNTLTISPQEAANGVVRAISLPDGQQTTISVPAGACDGQVLQIPLPDQTEMLTLILHIVENQDVSAPSSTIGPQQRNVVFPTGQPYDRLPLPRKKGIRSRVILLIVLAVVIIVGASTFFVVANNVAQQTAYSHQTSTAVSMANATLTAQANAATAVALATNTVREANPNPYRSGGTLTLYDKLDGNSQNTWTKGSECAFSDGAYHEMSNEIGTLYNCSLTDTPDGPNSFTSDGLVAFTDFTLEVNVTILKGDMGGVRFRSVDNEGYVLLYDVMGNIQISLYKDGNSSPQVLWAGGSLAIKRGYNRTNTLGVVVKGNTFTFYINARPIKSLSDSSYTIGSIALVGGLYTGSSSRESDVAFKTLRMWT